MDRHGFDQLARNVAPLRSRREALRGVAGALLGGLIGHSVITPGSAAARICLKPGVPCRRDDQCCSGTCSGNQCTRIPRPKRPRKRKKNKRDRNNNDKNKKKRCGKGAKLCRNRCVDIKNNRRHCGSCKRRCPRGSNCLNGTCVNRRGCKAGENICLGGIGSNCPQTNNPNCGCVTDVTGRGWCSNLASPCRSCRDNGDCQKGFVCIATPTDGLCACPGGKSCARASCAQV